MLKKTLPLILAVISFYVFYILSTTGYFRNIENHFDGSIVKTIPVTGAEDITVDHDDAFAIFVSFRERSDFEGVSTVGKLYKMDLSNSDFEYKSISDHLDFKMIPHGISLFQIDSSLHRLFVVNHYEGHTIEVFDLHHQDSLVHINTLKDDLIYSPNDLVAISEDEFYITNDSYYKSTLGSLAENYLALEKCEIIYCKVSDCKVVDQSISYANGINYDPKRQLLYVASVRNFEINVFEVDQNKDIHKIDVIGCGTGIDNLELDPSGNIWSGGHPNLLATKSFMQSKSEQSPSEIIKVNYKGKGDYAKETIFLDDGKLMSVASVAAPFRNYILTGNVCDDHFLILQRK